MVFLMDKSKGRWRSQENPGSGRVAGTNNWKWHREVNSSYVYDGSHLWVKNVSLGYSLPKSVLRHCNVRINLSADNLLLITKFPGNNPDVDTYADGTLSSYDSEAYPVPRTFSIGANITF